MAPTVVRDGRFRLLFFSREETRIHVLVAHPDGEEIRNAWNDHFGA